MAKPVMEKWRSNQNQEEQHFFIPDERNTYILGFNPKLVDKKKITALLKKAMQKGMLT